MDEWKLDFKWLRVRSHLKKEFGRKALPDLQEVLFLIGLQELGRLQEKFTKEEKQDLIHIGTCELLCREGYYNFKGRDQDGWPHYEHIRQIPFEGVAAQEIYLKEKITEYFQEYLNQLKE